MIPIYKENTCSHYVGYSDLVSFIEQNSSIGCDRCQDMVYNDILGTDNYFSFFKREQLFEEGSSYYSNSKYVWIKNFFNAHPFMNNIYFVYEE